MRNCFLEDKIAKLQTLNDEEFHKMIWQWIKQDNISLSEFKYIIDYFFIEKS